MSNEENLKLKQALEEQRNVRRGAGTSTGTAGQHELSVPGRNLILGLIAL